jgi:hypothetical protein
MGNTNTKKLVDSFGRDLNEVAKSYEVREQANEEARKHWDEPEFRAEFAADLTESILLGFESETLIDRFIETERLDFNGRSFITEATGLQAFWMARGGDIEMSQLTSETSELPRDMIGAHVSEFDDKFVNNFATQAQTYRDLIVQRLDAEVNRRVPDRSRRGHPRHVVAVLHVGSRPVQACPRQRPAQRAGRVAVG